MVLGSYCIFLGFLLVTGNLQKFINPKLAYLTIFSLVLLAAMFIHNLWGLVVGNKRAEKHHCDGGHHHGETVSRSSVLIFLPIVLSIVITPQTLSYQTNDAANSVQPVNSPEVPGREAPIAIDDSKQYQLITSSDVASESPKENSVEYTQLAIGEILFNNLSDQKQKLEKIKISLTGKVLKTPQLTADEVVLYRIVIACCAADGFPIGILVKLPPNTQLNPNDWVRVEGWIRLLPFEERLKPVEPIVNMVPPDKNFVYFTATKVSKLAKPANEYLYP